MFDGIPRRYDFLNRLLTLRLDERWRKRAARECLANDAGRVLDLCCGTGDLALCMARLAGPATEIHGLDFSASMLQVASQKAVQKDLGGAIEFIEGDAVDMKFGDDFFDSVGIAFAFRNLTWRNPICLQALSEVRRVIRPGGRFVVVETSQPSSKVLKAGYRAYLKAVVSPLGGRLSGHRQAYRYLARSARDFYTAGEVTALLNTAGFPKVDTRKLMGGIAAIHVAS